MQPEIVSTKLYLTVSTGHYRPLIPGKTTEDKWQFVQTELSRFAGRTLTRIGNLRPPWMRLETALKVSESLGFCLSN